MSTAKKYGIEKLNDYNHIRKRTEMYLGSRSQHTQEILVYEDGKPALKEMSWVPALYTAFREAFDNAIDEVVGHASGDRIDVEYSPHDLKISIADNGRGIPFDYDDQHNTHIATMVLTQTKAGRNFNDRGEIAGTNGLGISAVAMVSEKFTATIWRDGQRFIQSFREDPKDKELIIDEPSITKITSGKTGTQVEFTLSSRVFNDLTLPEEFVRSRVYDVAIANPNLKIYYNKKRIKTANTADKTLFPKLKPMILEVEEEGFVSKFILVPNFTDSGETVHSIVNNIPAFNGGVHIDNFKRLFYSGILTALESKARRRKVMPNRADVQEGLLIYNITRMKAPDFDSQSKTRLINESAGAHVKAALGETDYFKKIVGRYPEWIEEIFERAEERTNKKALAETKKAAKAAKKAKVEGLMDATGKNREDCILFLTEGLSSVSGISSVRDAARHGGLGLRGKVSNVSGLKPQKILNDRTLVSIMNSVGLMVGEKAVRDELRYGRVYIAADMDVDGMNIAALLINFFYTLWPELFDPNQEAYVHVFMTPFIIAEKGKQRKYWYAHDYHEFSGADYQGWTITRAKGLGSLERVDWEFAINNPVSVPIVDDGNMSESLDLLFNNDRADDRKVWLEE